MLLLGGWQLREGLASNTSASDVIFTGKTVAFLKLFLFSIVDIKAQ